jgi:pimeloyl-ACP methyl ester carboxylesterase
MNAPGEERFRTVEESLAMLPPINVPSIVLLGEDSGFGRPSDDPEEDEKRFANLIARRIVSGAGHDLPVQRPEAILDAFIELLS